MAKRDEGEIPSDLLRLERRLLQRGKARHFAAATLASVLAMALPRDARACTRVGYDWANNSAGYYIIANDFAAGRLNGLPGLTASQARFWIQWASSQWRERTDAGFQIFYAGDDTGRGMACGGQSDGLNQVDVTTSTCLNPPDCNAVGKTQPVVNGNNDAVEKDICISGPGSSHGTPWAITTPIPSSSNDLVGLLIHEFGHFAGLDHTANTVMNTAVLQGTRQRYPYGDDIDCSYVKWGSINRTRYFSAMPPQPASFGSPVQIGGGNDGHFSSNAAIGKDIYGQSWFVSGSLSPSWGLQFTSAHHPVNAQNPGWIGTGITSVRSRRPPSIASKPLGSSNPLWAAAWTVEEQTALPNGVMVAGSTDQFQTVSTVQALGDGSSWFVPQEPRIFFDSNSSHWVLLFIISNDSYNDELFATTSTDLVNWTSIQDLGFQALDAPDASCFGYGQCTMTFVKAYVLDPTAVTKSFTVNATTGALVLGSSNGSSFSDVPRGVGITASWVAGNPNTHNWLAAIARAGTQIDDLSLPTYRIFWSHDPHDPPLLGLAPLPPHPGEQDLLSNHRANIVSDPWNVDWTYIITTR